MPLPVQVFNLQVGVGGCARRAAVRSWSGLVGGAGSGRGGARGSGLGARASPASRPRWAAAPAPPPPRAPTLFGAGVGRAGGRGASSQDAGQPGAQLCLVVGLRLEPQPCAQQVRPAARHVGRLQSERQPVGLHAAFRGTAARPAGSGSPGSPEALAARVLDQPLPHRCLPALALLTCADRVSICFILCDLEGATLVWRLRTLEGS